MTAHHDHQGEQHGQQGHQSGRDSGRRQGRRGRHGRDLERGPLSPWEQVDRLVRDPGLDLDEFDHLAGLAEGMAEAVRALNHATLTRRAIPAPHVYPILGSLATTAWRVQQLLPQVTGCLAASLDVEVTGYRVRQDDGSDPLTALLDAEDHLSAAARAAGELAGHLDAAHSALSRQGYEPTTASRNAGSPAQEPW